MFEPVALANNAEMKRVFALGLLVLLVGTVVVMGFLARRKPVAPWFSAVSSGNGYDTLVRARSQMIGGVSEDPAEAAAFLNANEQMFVTLDAALKLPFEIPSRMYSLTNSLLADLGSFKAVALALRARGWEAERRAANAEAMTNYSSIIQLGQLIEHGPVIALLVGIAIEKIGLNAIEKSAARLPPAERKEIANKIAALDRERLPFSEVLLREEHYAHQVAGNPLKLLVARFFIRSSLIKAEQKEQKISADFQRAATELGSKE